MPTITISANNYQSYQDVAGADTYLAADIARSAKWAALNTAAKGQALVSASRWIATLSFADGAPDYTSPPQAVMDATTVLAADIAANPKLAQSQTGNTSQNVKRIKAGSVETEFWRESFHAPLPQAAYDILIASGLMTFGNDASAPYYSGGDTTSRFTYDANTRGDC